MPSDDRPVVVLGLLWAGLALARSLGRAGVPVVGIGWEETDFGLRSRYLRRRYALSSDRGSAGERVLAALEEVARDGRVLLIPERDESVEILLQHWDEVRTLADVPLPEDAEVTGRLRSKDRLLEEAIAAGIAVPRTEIVTDGEAFETLTLRPPFLLKPVAEQHFAYTFGEKVVVVNSREEARAAWRRASDAGFTTIAQELVPDARAKIYSLFTYLGRSGEPLANVVGRKVRQRPVDFGTSAVFELDFDERVRALGHRLLERAGYRGFAQVEFAHDGRDDTFKLLEVNTRLPMWAGIAFRPDFPMARLAYDDLCGRPVRPLGTLRGEGAWIYLAKDTWVALELARRRELHVGELLSPYLRARKARAILARDDPAPAFASLGYLGATARRALSRQRVPAAFSHTGGTPSRR